jgi:hypothetical protein
MSGPIDHLTGLHTGERRRDDAHALLEVRRATYLLLARRALLTALLERGTATADDVRDAVELPEDIDPVCLGAVPTALARAGIIERVGYVATRRPDAHARPLTLWGLRDRDAAIQWLADHPAPLDDDLPLWRAAAAAQA